MSDGSCIMPAHWGTMRVRLEIVVEGRDDQRLVLVVPDELWVEIEALAENDSRTPEQIVADVLGVGLSMTHGVG